MHEWRLTETLEKRRGGLGKSAGGSLFLKSSCLTCLPCGGKEAKLIFRLDKAVRS